MARLKVVIALALILLSSLNFATSVLSSTNIQSSGAIHYVLRYFLEFEKVEDFQFRESTLIWNRPVGLGLSYPNNLFEVGKIVHSGSQSAKFSLVNPVDDNSRRIHLQVALNPYDKYLWLECWYFIPENFTVDHWSEFHRSLYDQIMPENNWSFPQRQWLKIAIELNKYCNVSEREYHLLSHINLGEIDENGDGKNDLPVATPIVSPDTIRFGEWFKIKTYVFRDKVSGVYMMWLNDRLQWNMTNMRTIGVNPERFSEPNLNWQSGISSGIGLYSGELNEGITPKSIYIDDFRLSNDANSPF